MDAELNRQSAAAGDKPETKPEGDDLLGVIADVERQLASLKTVRAEREELRQRLDAREAELTERETKLRAVAERLHEAESAHEARGVELDRLEALISEQRQKIETESKAFEAERQRLAAADAARAKDIESRAQTLEGREQRLQENAAGLSRQRESLEQRTAALAEQDRSLRAREAELEQQRKALEEAKARSQADAQAAKAAAAEAEKARAELAGVRAQQEQASKAAESAQKRIAEVEAALGEARGEIKRSGEAQASLMKELSEKVKDRERLSAALDDARSKSEDFKRQLIDRDARVQDLSKKLAGATDKLREVSKSLQEQAEIVGQARALESSLAAKERALDEAGGHLRQRDERIKTLETQLAAKPSGKSDPAADRKAQALAAEVERLRSDLAQREQKIAALESAPAAGEAGDSAETARLQEALREANAELASALADNKRLRSERKASAAAGGGVPPEVGEAVARRWERLRILRTLVREQGDKLRQAGEALRGRYEQCEQILAQREELLAARNSVLETKRRIEKLQVKGAKNRAIATLFHVVIVMAGVGGLSWAIAGQIAPAAYIARASIAADTGGERIAPDVLASWQQFHEGLLNDPQMLEIAADRMNRRGIASLANPGALTQRLNADMLHQSAEPGRLVIELRGPGQGKTVRELDTYVTSLVSQANSIKDRRPDGLATTITEQAAAPGGPVEDQRPVYALGVFAIGFGLVSTLGVALWRKLASSKIRFEEGEMADAVLDAQVWNKPPEAFIKQLPQ